MSKNNWIIDNLENAFGTWNEKLAELWALLSESPETFKGGGVWSVMVDINGALQATAYGLLVLFTAMAIFGGTMNFRELRRPETALRYFIRFVCAKVAVTYAMDIMTTVFEICGGTIQHMAGYVGGVSAATVTLPDSIRTAIEDTGFFDSIPLWIVTLLGSLFITVLSFVLIMTVYGRFFKLYMYTAAAPLPLSTFGGEGTASHGKAFLKSYIGVCMEGAIIVLACLIFGGFTSGPPVVGGGEAVTQVWGFIAETVFNMLVLVGLIKGSDHIVKQMFGL